MLILPIKRKWFDMIKSGEKKEEYREIKLYWNSRIGKEMFGAPLRNISKELLKKSYNTKEFWVRFINGYSQISPTLYAKCTFNIGKGKTEWGAEPNTNYYVFKILEIVGGEDE